MLLLIDAFMYYLLRQTQSGNNQIAFFPRSRARLMSGDKPQVTLVGRGRRGRGEAGALFTRPYETGATILSSNRPIEDFGTVLGDNVAAGVLLDRFLHHAEIVQLQGRSFRIHDRQRRQAAGAGSTAVPVKVSQVSGYDAGPLRRSQSPVF